MKMKAILMIALAATLGASVLWVATDRAVAGDTASASRKVLYYTCPMHPSVKADKPGACPICGMNLVPVYDAKGGTNNPPAAVNTNKPAAVPPSCCSMAGGGCCQ
jgi:Cu(I)/Ag(I) efflux system membrane fusion protein